MRTLPEWLEQYGPLTPYAAADLLTQVALLLRDAREHGTSGPLTPAAVHVGERDDGLRARLGDLGDGDDGDDVRALGRVLTVALTGIAPTDPGADWLAQVLARATGGPDQRYPDLAAMVRDLRAAVVGIAAGSAVPSSLGGTPVLRTEPAAADPDTPARRSLLLPAVLALAVVLAVLLLLLR